MQKEILKISTRMIKANHHQEQAFFVLAALIAEINASNENVEQAVWIWNGEPNKLASHLKILMPVGTAIIIVALVK